MANHYIVWFKVGTSGYLGESEYYEPDDQEVFIDIYPAKDHINFLKYDIIKHLFYTLPSGCHYLHREIFIQGLRIFDMGKGKGKEVTVPESYLKSLVASLKKGSSVSADCCNELIQSFKEQPVPNQITNKED